MKYYDLLYELENMPEEELEKEVYIYVSPSAYKVERKLFRSKDTGAIYINKEGTVI